jgi:hypothetical protein
MTAIVILLVGAAFTAIGLSAYLGLWRSWSRTTRPNIIFVWLYLGIAALCMGVFAALLDTSLAGFSVVILLLGVLAGALFLGTLILGMPRWLLPRWYRLTRSR